MATARLARAQAKEDTVAAEETLVALAVAYQEMTDWHRRQP